MAPLDLLTRDQFAIWGLNVLVQVTVIAAVTLAFLPLLRRRLAVRHGLLCFAIVLLPLTPLFALVTQASGRTFLALSLSGEPLVDPQDKRAFPDPATRAAAASEVSTRPPSKVPALAQAPNQESFEQSGLKPQDAPDLSDAVDRSGGGTRRDESLQRPSAWIDRPVPERTSPSRATVWLLRQIMPPVLAIWLMGSLLLFCRAVGGWCRLLAVLRRARPIGEGPFSAPLANALRTLDVRGTIPLMNSPHVTSPLAAGVLRPRVVLPEAIHERITSEQLGQILIHEFAHVVRRDPFIALLQNIVAAMLWLHPLVHVLNRRLARAREEVCDNYVLSTTDAPTYSRTLLLLAELTTIARPLPGSVALFTSRWRLESRIAGILDERRNLTTRLTVRGKALAAGVALLAALAAAGATVSLVRAPLAAAAQENPPSRAVPPAKGQPGGDTVSKGEIVGAGDIVNEVVPQFDADPERGPIINGKPNQVPIAGMKAKIAMLDKVAAGAKASYERIVTWKGSGTYRVAKIWEQGPAPHDLTVQREADIRFAVDQKSKSLFVDWEERQPVRLVPADHSPGRLVTIDVDRFQSILTGDEWLDFRTARRFATGEKPLFAYDSSSDPRVLVIRSSPAAARPGFEAEGLIDSRLWIGLNGQHARSNRQFFWQEHEWLKQVDEELRRTGKHARAFDNCDVFQEPGPGGATVLVRGFWGLNGKPDRNDPRNLWRELAFEERYGYALTRNEHWGGTTIHERTVIEYQRRGPIAIPVRFTRTVNDRHRRAAETLDVRLAQSEVNVPLDPSEFTVERLHLKDGDRVLRESGNECFVIERGQWVHADKDPRSSFGWTPQATTSLEPHAFAGREWNDLVHVQVDLSNSWRHARPEQLPPAERKQAYAQHREASERIASRLVALHPLYDARRSNTLDGLNCLGEVIRMEYAGAAAEEAAAILLANHSLAKAQPFFAMLFGYSLPASLAAETVLRGMIVQSESRATQAQARMSLARFLNAHAEQRRLIDKLPGRAERMADEYGDWYLGRIRKIDPERADREAESLWKEVIDHFADVAISSDSEKLAVQAERDLKGLRHATGRKAREIVGQDFDGKPMRLSDTDGKVRVLMFWGNWCRPCRDHYPHLRSLLAKHAKAPFAVLGVCSDERKDQIRKSVADGSVNWPFWWDGDDDRWKIHREWGLAGSPWFFVLDRQGVIRFAEIEGPELDAAVDLLLREKTGGPK